jgi:hypothetical protein
MIPLLHAYRLGDPREAILDICGKDVRERCKRVWGTDREGEINGNCRNLGVPGLWYIMGNGDHHLHHYTST